MSVQPSSEIAGAPNWSGWQSAVINGVYPLQRLLSGSEHGAVFLTECKGRSEPTAALKIIPIERVTLAQLSHWKSVTGLFHPHLMQLFDAGLCQLGGHQFLFVVMEYAEQTLAQVLRQRALTLEEVREMLPPTLEALAFLHGKGLVHGQLKPANVLVVNDQLKLSSDSIRPEGAPRVGGVEPSAYDPPEANQSPFSSAGDIWGLGITLVEALTQGLPSLDVQAVAVSLPPTVPQVFVDMVKRYLSYDPATRPSATDLEVRPGNVPQSPVMPMQAPPAPRGLVPRFAVIGSVGLLAVVWAGWQLFHTHPNSRPTSQSGLTASQQAASLPATATQNPQSPGPASATTMGATVHVQPPDVPRKALGTIRGHFRIAVLVVVDHSGTAIRALLKNTGPSPYFARRTLDAAMKSKFPPTDKAGSREWLLRFEFARSGVTADATPER